MTKAALRNWIVQQLKQQKEDDRRRRSAVIRRKLRHLEVFQKAKTIVCYVSLSYEVETWRLIEQMFQARKRVVVPVVHKDRLRLSALRDPCELAPGAFGVREPLPHARRWVSPDDVDLVLVPGLAFDRSGHRLGHGRGYFDRLLARVPRTTPRVGVCFAFQLLDRLPHQPHDQPVHTVISA
jgi:5-formyltetrahydrofolate cyclo-ligase